MYLEKNIENLVNHSYFLPTYEQCRQICDANGNLIFFETKHIVGGFNVSIFNYRLAFYGNFDQPIPDNSEIKAHELRGLTFVFNQDGTIFNRYLLLDKFWNLNQTPCSQYGIVKNYSVKSIMNKEDGSIVSFVKLPSGEVVGKSKAYFESDQGIGATKIYNTNPSIKRFVDWALDNEIVPIFEYVSPYNRVVVPYSETDLVLIRLRNNINGEHLDISDFSDKLDGIKIPLSFDMSLDDLIAIQETKEGIEGWIVQFTNGKLIKVKTKWYCDLHGLLTEEVHREDSIISMILDETIDDVISRLSGDQEKIDEIESIEKVVVDYLKKSSIIVDDLLSKFTGDKKEFALTYKKHEYFNVCMSIINYGYDKLDALKVKIKYDTKYLQMARTWLKKHGTE